MSIFEEIKGFYVHLKVQEYSTYMQQVFPKFVFKVLLEKLDNLPSGGSLSVILK